MKDVQDFLSGGWRIKWGTIGLESNVFPFFMRGGGGGLKKTQPPLSLKASVPMGRLGGPSKI